MDGNPAGSGATAKVVCFDSIRGLAALLTMVFHVVLAFWPAVIFRNGPAWDQAPFWLQAIVRFPLKYFFNGHLILPVFYVLSGFVLSIAFFRSGSMSTLSSAARRRYLRLMLPVAASVMTAYVLMSVGAMRSQEAVAAMNDAYGMPQQSDPNARPGWSNNWLAAYYGFAPTLSEALREATWGALVHNCPYNAPLYTMRNELLGSFLVFGFLALFGTTRNRWLIYAIVAGLCLWNEQWHMVDFVAGMALCDLGRENQQTRKWSLSMGQALVLVGLALFVVPWGHAAAYLLIGTVVVSPGLQQALSRPWLVSLGRRSFGLYVIHMPILCSLGCGVYLMGRQALHWSHTPSGLLAGVVFVPVMLAIAWAFDRWIDGPTLTLVRRLDEQLFRSEKTPPPATLRKAA